MSAMSGRYLSFEVSGETFAVDILLVREIIEYSEVTLTTVPLMPEVILGVVNLRGKAVPVIDLATRLMRNSAEVSRRTCIVVLEVNRNDITMEVGVMVDAVKEVMLINSSDIEQAPSFGESLNTDFIAGMGKIDERFVMMLDIGKTLSMSDLQLMAEVA
jgi:purine-binding chemotaxis protein CheW